MSAKPDLGSVIADYLRDAEARAATRADVRDLRRDLTHVASALGATPVDAIRGRDVQALLDDLLAAGVSPDHLRSTVDSLRSLYAYAIDRGLVRTSPLVGIAVPGDESRAPTQALLALGERLVTYTVRTIVIASVLVAVGLVLALA